MAYSGAEHFSGSSLNQTADSKRKSAIDSGLPNLYGAGGALLFDPDTKIIVDIFNSDFSRFREKHGRGQDFMVLSPLHRVKNFKAQCWDTEGVE